MLDGAGSRGQGVRIVNMADRPDGGSVATDRPLVNLSSFTVTKAKGGQLWADGSGIFVFDAQVSLTDMTIKENAGYQCGGLQAVQSTLTLLRCDLLGNQARGDGGGLYLDRSTVTITDAKISGNESDGRGGAIALSASPLAVTNSVITGNGAGTGDGAIAVAATQPRTAPVLTGCTVFGNYPGDPKPTAAAPPASTDLKGAWEVILIEADGDGEAGIAVITADDGQSFSGNAFGNEFSGTRSQDAVSMTATTSLGTVTLSGRVEADFSAMSGTFPDDGTTAFWRAQRRGTHQGQTILAAPLEVFDVQVAAGFAYAATATGLVVFDLADPYTPVPVAHFETMKSIATDGTIRISGSRAYLADWDNGLQIFDISSPSKPVLLGTFRTMPGYRTVEVSGTTAYLSHHWSGLQIVDVADPARPHLLGGFGYGEVFAIALAGKYAYLGMGKEMKIVDISNPAKPVLTGAYAIPGYDFDQITTIGLDGASALLGDFYSPIERMILMDIANPAAPVPVGTTQGLMGNLGFLAVNRGFIAFDNLLQVYDLTEPAHPVFLKEFPAPGAIRSLVIDNGMAYLACGQAGLRVIDLGELKKPVIPTFSQNTADLFAGCDKLVVERERGYMRCGPLHDTLRFFDFSTPSAPVLLGEYPAGEVREFLVRETTVYALTGASSDGSDKQFQVISAADPAQAVLISSYQCGTGGWSWEEGGIAVGEGLVAVRCPDSAQIDLLTLGTPDVLPRAGVIQSTSDTFALSGSLLFVLDNETVQVIDVADPAHPAVQGTISVPLDHVRGMKVRDRVVYILGEDQYGPDFLMAYDCSEPRWPVRTVRLPLFISSGSNFSDGDGLDAMAIRDQGNALSTHDYLKRLLFLDLSDPRMPALAGEYELTAAGLGGFLDTYYLSGTGLYLAGSSGLARLDLSALAGVAAQGGFRSGRGFSAEHLAGEAGRLYVSGVAADAISSSTMLFDTIDPGAPQLLSTDESHSVLGDHSSFALDNHHFYLDCLDHITDIDDQTILQLRVINVAAPAGPTVLATLPLPLPEGISPSPKDMILNENLLAIAGGMVNGMPGWVLFVDVTTPAQPAILASQSFGPGSFGTLTDVYDPHRLLLSQGRAFVFASRYYGEDSRLFCLDLANPAAPTLLGELPLSGGGTVVTAGPPGVIFAASDATNGILRLDVTNPAAPRITSFYQTSGQVRDILYQAGTLYAATGSGGVRVFAVDP